jgi:glycosyltransferase involved in cell wall biosynthesis
MGERPLINILAIRTRYPQWAARSGIAQYLNYLDKASFTVSEQVVSMEDDSSSASKGLLKKLLKRALKFGKPGNAIYDVNDIQAELTALRRCWTEPSMDVIQYLDPEHSLCFLPALLRTPFVGKKRKPALVAMFHQTKSVLKDIMPPRLARKLDHVILMSSEQKAFFENDVDADRMSVILHGIDTEYFKPDHAKRWKNKFICVTVGHWLRDYDVLEMVAASLLDRESIEFHIVSSIQLKHKLKNVFMHRSISDRELLDLYQRADLLFMPFKDATANNAILEGMACGLPILTTDLIATREYAKDAGAFYVKNNDIGEFRQCIIALESDDIQRNQLGERSRVRALELSWPKIAKQYESLYRDLSVR